MALLRQPIRPPLVEVRGDICAFDPGITTGYARVSSGGVLQRYAQIHNQLEFGEYLEHCGWCIVESFRLFPNKSRAKIGSSFPEIEVIGALKYQCQKLGIPVIEQMPAVKKFFMPVSRLEYYNYHIRGEHARDAARHILYYLVFVKHVLPVPKEG